MTPPLDGEPISTTRPLTEEPEALSEELSHLGEPSEYCYAADPIAPDTVHYDIYERHHKISSVFENWNLQPFSLLYPDSPRDPAGWHQYVTPEGRPYFCNTELNLYTNLHLTRKTIASDLIDSIERTARSLRTRYSTQRPLSEDGPELVIALLQDNKWGYYFADNTCKTVRWVDPIPLLKVVGSCTRSVPTDSHLNLMKESQYWHHVEMFPAARELKQETITELSGLLACAYTDTITSTTATSPYPADKLELIFKVLESVEVGDITGRSAWIVARFMNVFKREMFLHYYGQDGARLDRDQSVHFVKKEIPRPRYIFLLFSYFLFYMPYVHKKKLDEVFVDSLLNEEHWNRLLENLRKEWEMTVTPSTVLLSANVAFLAIGSVDNSGGSGQSSGPPSYRSPEQIMSYVSTVFSLASWLVCWILVQRHAPAIGSSTSAGINYLKQREKCMLGLEADAIVFSLPSAFFTWSMLLFCAAVVWICLVHSDFATQFTMIFVLGLMAATLCIVLQVSWTSIAPLEDNLWTRHKEAATKVRQASKEFVQRRGSWSFKLGTMPAPQVADRSRV
ncbi:uncharacterized protein PHACADRAFT_210792 [Phanerochaete carnosa HHB-10118-sp]|uniref:WW domain-containing protein n=1 Tax=Phanerochaete carnosa (strain HHB-10118-sp) TaxID=650164 RepID=K5WRQ3_PHACS|nr:uncharacterized protein PHACADRAFT_210792 [Phanerochaete carnosa HHB-10118-sp]EKM53067.1 hypothetical protein PHACADRAFT_210792 [Phanerochaete carnosa HHB-10118-sp]